MLFDPLCYFLFYNFIVAHRYFDLGFVVISPPYRGDGSRLPVHLFRGVLAQPVCDVSPVARSAPGTQLLRYLLSVAGSILLTYAGLKFFVELCGYGLRRRRCSRRC